MLLLQVLAILARGPFNWPQPPVQQILDAATVANLDLSLFATSCTLTSFPAQYVLSVAMPAVFGLAVLAAVAAAKWATCLFRA